MKATVEVTEANFETEVLKSEQPALVGFATSWALPCMIAEEALEEIAAESASLKVACVKLDHNPNLGLWYGIRRIPTLLCFVNGEERVGIFGVATKEAILAELKPFITSRPSV
jgi:thioredoxin 1